MHKTLVAAFAALTMFTFTALASANGVADNTNIKVNGTAQKVVTDKGKGVASACKNGGYKTFTNPTFKNQGQCVKYLVHSRNAAKKAARG